MIERCEKRLAEPLSKKKKRRIIIGAAAFVLVLFIGAIGAFTGVFSSENRLEYDKLEDGSGYVVTGAFFKDRESFEIPDSYLGLPVVAIGNYAFSYCDALTGITIPESVKTIGAGAFFCCEQLKSVKINGALSIDEYAFAECYALVDVEFSASLTEAGTKAFQNCSSLREIELPSSLEVLGYGAFEGCSSLESMVVAFVGESKSSASYGFGYIFGSLGYDRNDTFKIPENIEKVKILGGTVAENAFRDCKSIKTVEIGPEVRLVGKNAFTGCTNLLNVTVDSGITAVGEYAFADCTSVAEIILPDSVTCIGAHAFENCSGLEVVKLGKNGCTVGEGAFASCAELMKVDGAISSVGKNAFLNCHSLSAISLGALSGEISDGAFYNCQSLDKIVLPEGITLIGKSAFEGCAGVLEISLPQTLYSIGERSFCGCTNLKSIVIPNSVISMGFGSLEGLISLEVFTAPFLGSDRGGTSSHIGYLFGLNAYDATNPNVASYMKSLKSVVITDTEAIGDAAFYGCESLTSVALPAKLKTIGIDAFAGCKSLKTVDIPDAVSLIGAGAFAECDSLGFVNLPKGVSEISSSLFFGCDSLSSVEFSGDIVKIGERAFKNCQSLSFTIPETVTTVCAGAFSGCDKMSSVVIPSSVEFIGFGAFESTPVVSITLPFIGMQESGLQNRHFGYIFGASAYADNANKVPVSLKTVVLTASSLIPENAFRDCASITDITLPASVTAISQYAFSGCLSLKSFDIPQSVELIDDYAFSDCTGLKSFVIPNTVTSVGLGVFSGCVAIESVKAPFVGSGTGSTHFGYIFGAKYGSDNSRCVPESLKSVIITSANSIPPNAFYGCSTLTSIELPYTTVSIGSAAFAYCTSIKEFTIPKSVAAIGYRAFYSCTGLEKLYFNAENCSAVSENAEIFDFAGAEGNGIELTVGISVTEIPENLFRAYYSERGAKLVNVSFVSGSVCEAIDNYAFSNLKALTAVDLSDSAVETIGSCAFSDASALSSLTLSNELISIGENAFNGASSLKSVDLPSGLKYIYSYAFSNSGVKTFYIPESVTLIDSYAFSGCVICCESKLKPAQWDSAWNSNGELVYWNCVSEIKYSFVTGTDESVSDINAKGAVMLPAPTRDGYTFLGWYTDASCTGKAHTGPYYSASDVILYAKWTNSITIGTSLDNALLLEYASETEANIVSGGLIVYFAFTPDTSGNYTFKSLAEYDTYGVLYNAQGKEIRRNRGNPDFIIDFYLNAGQTYYLAVYFCSKSETGNFAVTVN